MLYRTPNRYSFVPLITLIISIALAFAFKQKQNTFRLVNPLIAYSSVNESALKPLLGRRQLNWDGLGNRNLSANLDNTQRCPSTRRTAHIGIVTDCTYTATFNSTEAARRHIEDIVHTTSVVFETTFNISLEIRNLTISDPECPASSSTATAWNSPCSSGDMNWRLERFSSWRSRIDDNNAYWTLLTGCSSSSGEVGVSWIGALCNSGNSGFSSVSSGVGTNVVARTDAEWQVFA
ncbi:uncharacterized protein N7482_002428 [Penicillium canariense]|uniref:Peptidase M12B domain-containing protein n=1 Tax=Penicillium canariense TaxID=189055 RepID=A0A9W9IJ09_9EURO|nr:uncharacterized protein N7482_002428 [Penicillium canariense]KAJ5176551.1 hypothetical protein N7482_002428 [Penicillium canariense]